VKRADLPAFPSRTGIVLSVKSPRLLRRQEFREPPGTGRANGPPHPRLLPRDAVDVEGLGGRQVRLTVEGRDSAREPVEATRAEDSRTALVHRVLGNTLAFGPGWGGSATIA
jgi:hypothetical protein